ncbi:MAG: hypothetical protein AAF135_11640 [Bacteroidota bacterium]
MLDTLLSPYPRITTIPVQWGDRDAFGHAHNVVYLKWAESGSNKLLRKKQRFLTNGCFFPF